MHLEGAHGEGQVPTGGTVDATVVVVTHNRKDLLKRALQSALEQTAAPEVVVIDDASADGTAEMLRRDFPQVRLFQAAGPRGYVEHRTVGARLARGRVIVSIDDDAFFMSPTTVEQVLDEFDHPRIGAVAIPYVEDHEAPRVRQQPPAPAPIFATFRFTGCAYAVRRDVFVRLGGYRRNLVEQGEETEFCLRMLAAGYVTRLGNAVPLRHLSAPPYDVASKCRYDARNAVLHAWWNVPMPYLLARLVKVVGGTGVAGVRLRHPIATAHGLGLGVKEAVAGQAGPRSPVERDVYRLAHILKTRGAIPLPEVETRLPPLQS